MTTGGKQVDRDSELGAQGVTWQVTAGGRTVLAEVRFDGGPLTGAVFLGPADVLWKAYLAYTHEPKTYQERRP